MSATTITIAIAWIGLALAHSVLGEQAIVRPLETAEWEPDDIPVWAAVRLVRVVWHLVSIAWLAFGAIALGANTMVALGVAGLASAALMAIPLPQHGAWPVFLVAGLVALREGGALPNNAVQVIALVAAAVLAGLTVLHVGWAFGRGPGLENVTPTHADGTPAMRAPSRALTLAVAGLIATFAGLLVARVVGAGPDSIRWLVAAGAAVLAVRAIGDGKVAGFTKKHRESRFGYLDDRVFTPLCVMLSAAAASLALV